MIILIISIIVIAALAAVFAWLTRRTWGAKNAVAKWVGVVLAGLLTLIFALLAVVAVVGTYKLYHSNDVSTSAVTLASTPQQIARGEHLADVLCASCHSLDGNLPLSGGKNLSEDAGLPLGDLFAPNITPAGDIKDMSDSELFRLIRTGVNEEGRATAMTAVAGARVLSDEDTLALVAFLRQSSAAQGETPPFNPTILMALFVGAGLIPLDAPANVHAVSAPPKAATSQYGEYVMAFMDCTSCHGVKLDGKVPPPYPPSPDIRLYLSHWSKDDLANVTHAYASTSQASEVMPWRFVARLDSVEFEALYLYLHDAASK